MANTRSAFIQIRVTPEEKEIVRRKAQAAGLSVSDYLRTLGLAYRVVVEPEETEPQDPL